MGEWGLENKNLVILWDGCKVSPYVKAQEGIASGQCSCHGEDGLSDFSPGFHIDFSTRIVFRVIPEKVIMEDLLNK